MSDGLDGPSTKWVALAICMAVGAFISAVDEALAAYGGLRAREARESSGPDAGLATRYLRDERTIEDRLLTGRVLSVAAVSALAYSLASSLPTLWTQGALLAAVAATFAGLLGAAVTLATRRASRVALPLLALVRPLELLLALPALPLSWARAVVERAFPASPEDDPECFTEEVVERMIEQGEEHGSIDEKHAELLKSVLEFGDTITREVMVPRTSMVAIEIGTPLRDVVGLIVGKGHSRYPVYRERIDQLEGILYAKDLFRWIDRGWEGNAALSDLIRGPVFRSAESQKISDLLRQMQLRRVHVAIVVDEYGGTSGMITLEDIIEEIVGDISDEHDFGEAPVRQLGPGRYVARADVSVHDVRDITGLEPPEEHGAFESLGGMLVELAGDVPKRGQTLTVGEYDLIVRAADERHVVRVEIVHRPTMPGAAE